MSKYQKLRTVIRHEFLTIIKQPSFWISLVAFPLLAGIVVLIGSLTDSSKDVDTQSKDHSIAVIDSSGVIRSDIASKYGLDIEPATQQARLESDVRSGSIDGLIVYPGNLLDTGSYRLFADDTDKNNSALIKELGRSALQQSLLAPLGSSKTAGLALSGGQASVQSFKNGQDARKPAQYVVPGAFLVLFYIILVFSVGYALTSVSEEKENRSVEMVLSYLNPRTLIAGKLAAIILVTLVQIVCIGILALIGYGIARSMGNNVTLPFSLSDLTFVPAEIALGAGFLVFGFIFYIGLMATIGAIFPSAKEASGFSTVFFLLPAIPFWGLDAVTDRPSSTFTQILTYFPLSSPTTALIRNAAGNLTVGQGIVSLLLLVAASIAIIVIASKAFQLGTLEYNRRIKLSALFRR